MMKNNNSNDDVNDNNLNRKPRQSVKADAIFLNGLLREGLATVIDAGKMGKRLSSEIWISFGAIQVKDNFTSLTVDTKLVYAEGSPIKICRFFVACSECYSVFKYDGHAYGTTGLVKHVKVCQGMMNKKVAARSSYHTSNQTIDTTLTEANTSRHLKATTNRGRQPAGPQPSLNCLAKVVEELRCEQWELKQQIQSMINMLSGTSYVNQIQVISTNEDQREKDSLEENDCIN